MKNHFDSIDQVNNLREIQVGSWWGNGNHRELTYIDCVKPNQGPWENKSNQKQFAFVWPWSHCPICKNHYDFWQQQVVAPTHKSLKGDRLYVLYIDFFAHYMRLITLNHWIFIIRADTLYKDYSWSYHASLRNLDVLGVAPFGGASQHHQTARGAIGWLLNLVLKEAGKPCDETVSASIDLSDFCSSVWEAAVR